MSRIDTPFGFSTTAAEVVDGLDFTGRRVVITGGASGIGIETARALAGIGAHVTLAVRNTAAATPVVEELIAGTGNPAVHVTRLDLADRASIAGFVEAWTGPLDVLVNNAGILALPELERTAQGWEMQFATNYLGHFALTLGLHPALAAATHGARVVSLSSSGHLFSPVIFDDLHFDFVPYDPYVAYGQSKTATALLAVGITAHWAGDGITSNAVMPGAIATRLQRHTGGLRTPPERRKSLQQGAATSVFAATSPLVEGVGGRYLEDVQEARVVDRRGPEFTGVAAYALDSANAERLWAISRRLLA